MSIPMTLAEFDELGEPILAEVFFAGFQRAMDAASAKSVLALFNVMPSTKEAENTLSIGGLGAFEERTVGAGVNYDKLEQLFKTTFTNLEYQKTIPVDANMIADQNYIGVSQIVSQMGVNAARTMMEQAAGHFNNAFSGSYLGGDGKALCVADHPLDRAGDNEGDNTGTDPLTYANVKAARLEMRKFADARNKRVIVVPDTIVCPVDLEEDAWQIAKAVGKPGEASNDENFFRGLNVVADLFLTDVNNWWLVDSVLSKEQLMWFERDALTTGLDRPTQTDRNYYWGAFMRHSSGWSDWRFLYGNEVA